MYHKVDYRSHSDKKSVFQSNFLTHASFLFSNALCNCFRFVLSFISALYLLLCAFSAVIHFRARSKVWEGGGYILCARSPWFVALGCYCWRRRRRVQQMLQKQANPPASVLFYPGRWKARQGSQSPTASCSLLTRTRLRITQSKNRSQAPVQNSLRTVERKPKT